MEYKRGQSLVANSKSLTLIEGICEQSAKVAVLNLGEVE
jgi:hypothetical protein